MRERQMLKPISLVAAALCLVAGISTATFTAGIPDGAIAGLKSKYADITGIRTRYYEMGIGEPMVMISAGSMGASCGANVWSRNIPGLAKKFHVYALDRLGCGGTANPPTADGYTYQAEVDFVYNFVKTMKLSQVHFVGHSYGGNLIVFTAIQHPDIAKSLTLIGMDRLIPEESLPPGQSKSTELSKNCPSGDTFEGAKCRGSSVAYFPDTYDAEFWSAEQLFWNMPKSQQAREQMSKFKGQMQWQPDVLAWRNKLIDLERNEGVLQMPILVISGAFDAYEWPPTSRRPTLQGQRSLFELVSAKNLKAKWIVISNAGTFVEREQPDTVNLEITNFVDYWDHHTSTPISGRVGAAMPSAN